MTMDNGKTWTDLTSKLPQKKWVAKVLPSQYDDATVYLAQQGRYDDDFAVYLYKSTDYGKTWKSIAGNLPGGPINMIREDPVSANILYTCNDFGVYASTNGGVRWDVLGGNLPSVDVMDFIVHPRDHVLVAATHGRGVWVIDVSKIEGGKGLEKNEGGNLGVEASGQQGARSAQYRAYASDEQRRGPGCIGSQVATLILLQALSRRREAVAA
jgi:hypothetical protein